MTGLLAYLAAPLRALPVPSRIRTGWSRLTARELPRDRWRDALLVLFVAVPICFNAIALWPEVARPIPSVNDDAFHYMMIRSASDAIARGENPLDPWGPEMDLGAPRFLFYQNLPAVFVIALDRVTLGRVGLLNLLNITRYVLMLGLPLTVFWAMRRLEFSRIAAAGAAAASSLFATNGLYGIEYDSFVWRGWGMYTQLWAVHLSLLTLTCIWRLARTGRGALRTVLAASALVVSHLLYAEMMVVSGSVLFLVGVSPSQLKRRLPQFLAVGLLIGALTSYLWLTYLLNGPYVGESPYDAQFKLDSFGAPTILGWLFAGELFDYHRFPVITLSIAVGVASLLFLWGRQRFLAIMLFVVWLALYFGRSIWGPLADHIPSGSMLLFHRFIGSFHIAALLLIGMGIEAIWRFLALLPRPAALAAATAACALFLAPAIIERQSYYAPNALWMGQTDAAYRADKDAQQVFATLRALPPGRVYAGLRANWGESLRIDQVPMYRVLIFEGFSVVSVPLPSINLNSDLMFHFNDQDPAFYDLYDVRYVVAPRGLAVPSFLAPLAQTPRYAVYRAPGSGAAVYATSTIRRSAAAKMELFFANRAWLLGGEPTARSFIRWDYPAPKPEVTPVREAGCTDGRIANEVMQPDRVDFDATCSVAATVVIKSTYTPDWHVTVDGNERRTFMVSPSYIGVELPAGAHRVHAEYRSSRLRSELLVFGVIAFFLVVTARPFIRPLRALLT